MTHDPSSWSKFLVRAKSRTRMHDKRYKFLVRVSRARNLDQELGSCVMGLKKLLRRTRRLCPGSGRRDIASILMEVMGHPRRDARLSWPE